MKYGSSDEKNPSELFNLLDICFIPVSTEQDVWHIVWILAHLFTDDFQFNIRAAFDDQFTMNMTNVEAVHAGDLS